MDNPAIISAASESHYDYNAFLNIFEKADSTEGADESSVTTALGQLTEEFLNSLSDKERINLIASLESLAKRTVQAEEGSPAPRAAEAADRKLWEFDRIGQYYKSLPAELKQRVIAYLDKKTQAALAQTSHAELAQVRSSQTIYTKEYKVPDRKVEELSEDPKKLAEILIRFPNLEKLDLSSVDLTKEHFEILKQYVGNLTYLNLITTLRSDEVSLAYIEFLKSPQAQNLRELDLELYLFYELDDPVPFVEALAQSSSLRTLDLLRYGIGWLKSSAVRFAEALGQLRSLRVLKISENHLAVLGANAVPFAEELAQLTSLRALDLSGNLLGYLGANAVPFAEALSQLTSLRTLDLSGNEFGNLDKNLKPFIRALREGLPNCEIIGLPEA